MGYGFAMVDILACEAETSHVRCQPNSGQSNALGGTVAHYRDSNGLEVDVIVETPEGTWGAFEVKLGGDAAIDSAAEGLLTFSRTVDTAKVGEPAILAVVTGGQYGYTRPDGVAVIPIGALGP